MGIESRLNKKIFEEKDDLKAMKEFVDFIQDNAYMADSVREAYYRLCDVSEREEETPEVIAIVAKMQEMVQEGFPLNWFAKVIGKKQEIEDAVPSFHSYVDTLKISDNEKKVLVSIVEKKRSGEVSCLIDGTDVASFNIKNAGVPKEVVATALREALEKILEKIPEGLAYEFTFSES